MHSFLFTFRGFSKEFDPCINQVVLATLNVYKESLRNLLPTPAKSHYLFNLRDFSRVIQVYNLQQIFNKLSFNLPGLAFNYNFFSQGVLLSVPESMPTLASMKRLWVHEILRVFGDRLIDETDIGWLIEQLHKTVKQHMDADFDDLFHDLASSPKKRVVKSKFTIYSIT